MQDGHLRGRRGRIRGIGVRVIFALTSALRPRCTTVDVLDQRLVELSYDVTSFDFNDALKVSVLLAIDQSLNVHDATGIALDFKS